MQITKQKTTNVILSTLWGVLAGFFNENVLAFSALMILVFYTTGWALGVADVLTGGITEVYVILRMIPVFLLLIVWIGMYLFSSINQGLNAYKRLST